MEKILRSNRLYKRGTCGARSSGGGRQCLGTTTRCWAWRRAPTRRQSRKRESPARVRVRPRAMPAAWRAGPLPHCDLDLHLGSPRVHRSRAPDRGAAGVAWTRTRQHPHTTRRAQHGGSVVELAGESAPAAVRPACCAPAHSGAKRGEGPVRARVRACSASRRRGRGCGGRGAGGQAKCARTHVRAALPPQNAQRGDITVPPRPPRTGTRSQR